MLYCVKSSTDSTIVKVSCRCRDPIIRRRAISLLRTYDRTEGAWNSFATYKAAQRVLDIEEAGLQNLKSCDDVPGWARISNVSLAFDHAEKRAALTYNRPIDEYGMAQQMTEVIEW